MSSRRRLNKGINNLGITNKQNNTNSNSNASYIQTQNVKADNLDLKYNLELYTSAAASSNDVSSSSRDGYLFSLRPTLTPDRTSGLLLYLVNELGETFRALVEYKPYFYVMTSNLMEVERSIKSRIDVSCDVTIVNRWDLGARGHLTEQSQLLKLEFDTTEDLIQVRTVLRGWDTIDDLREYDVPYTQRVCIDMDLRCGAWYTLVPGLGSTCSLTRMDRTTPPPLRTLAFDIECTKAPLMFPNSSIDSIYMISYMTNDGQGYLITDRSIVSSDVDDFEYTPLAKYPGEFVVFNEPNEEALLRRFLSHVREIAPQIIVTYNGDSFDFPFLDDRCKLYGLNLYDDMLGMKKSSGNEEHYTGQCCVHLDAFKWVIRDSYLPQGSQGLKAVTKYKLGYDPVEVDPEDMVKFAQTKPVHMATYSVSDAVATFYLYQNYVHLFIFSLCTLLPLDPEDVLRKGSGTLCETLLMVQAFEREILCPNKQKDDVEKFYKGHLLESETYIGGHVECLETGVFRSDCSYKFEMVPAALDKLIGNVDRDLKFAIEVEFGMKCDEIENYDDVKQEIIGKLEALRDCPEREEEPFIYHLDVGAMYPNIILTNRLQPDAIVDDAVCAGCEFNSEENQCKRKMEWVWRGDFSPASRAEYDRVKTQLMVELVDGRPFTSLSHREQADAIASRLKMYSKTAYKRTKVTLEEKREDTVCMRENPFYVETVRLFRDRRYEYKQLTKKWKKEKAKADSKGDAVACKVAEDQALVYDSLQVAHKCILNSFYGYVMRKGARWRSIEMAGIVTLTGANIIRQARELVEQIGRPLELDTDGIWCILPKSFPDKYNFKTTSGGKVTLEYPCVMLNADVHHTFSNHQYQTLVDPKAKTYDTRSECSIFFEVDGPYRCMVLPASTEEGILLKKRYAVFNFDGSMAELKGFELKRRGELELVKAFQSQVFERFLDGDGLEGCYEAVADVANYWMDVLDTQGESLDTEELFDLISENRNMSRQLADYGDQKGTSQTTARRLSEFLGAEIIKDKGLNCKFILSERPHGAPVTERAIPVAIWKAEPSVMRHFLRKWLKAPELDDFDVRGILDWDYYKQRLGKTIQKIITIPAGLQNISNPVPRIPHPDWLRRKMRNANDKMKQRSILAFTKQLPKAPHQDKDTRSLTMDIEDTFDTRKKSEGVRAVVRRRKVEVDKQNVEKTVVPGEKSSVVVTPPKVQLKAETFSEWLTIKKNKWRLERDDRKRRIRDNNRSNLKSTAKEVQKRRKIAGVEGFIREAALAVTHKEWQVIEIREDDSYGTFTLFIMLDDNSLQKVQVAVPRTMYANSKDELSNRIASGNNKIARKRVNRSLPHGKSSFHLYEVSMAETYYQRHWSQLEGSCLADDDERLESVYETKTPLSFRALLNLGCVSRLSQAHKDNMLKTYDLDKLERVEKPRDQYFHSEMSFRRIFVYENIQQRGKVGIVALFVMSESHKYSETPANESLLLDATCHLWIIKPGRNKKGERTVNNDMSKCIFRELISNLSGNSEETEFSCLSPASTCSVETMNFVNEDHVAFAGINEVLAEYSLARHGPTFLLSSISRPLSLFRKSVPAANDFPLIPMPSLVSPVFEALSWERNAVQFSMEAYIQSMAVQFPKRVKAARYGNVPIANLGTDENLALYDVLFGRQLISSRALLWASESRLPDLGGKEGDIDIWGDEVSSPITCNSGAYRSICVELDVHYLTVAALYGALTQSLHQNTFEGFSFSKSAQSIVGADQMLGDEMSCAMSFHLFRTIVLSWVKDLEEKGQVIAQDLIEHCYRMVCSPEALLFDPALQRVLHSAMKATYSRLMGEFERLCVEVVYGSFSRIIICTGKRTPKAAKEYIDFILTTIKAKDEELARLELIPNKVCDQLLFLDEYNYGGLEYQARELDEDEEADFIAEIDGTELIPTVFGQWNIQEYLSSEIQQLYFQTLVSRFSRKPFEKLMKLNGKSEDGSKLLTDDVINEQFLEFRRNQITNSFSSDLTRMLGEVIKDEEYETTQPPLLPGSHLPSSHNMPLEFVKTLFSVLELDRELEKEVHGLKQSALIQIGVQEYSFVTKWQNPCASFVLPDLFCRECHESRDLNLCVEHSTEWACSACGSNYESSLIEWRLVEHVERKSALYQVQDLIDPKTNMVAKRSLARQSEGAQQWYLDNSLNSFEKELEVLLNVASFHKLEWLHETVYNMLNNWRINDYADGITEE